MFCLRENDALSSSGPNIAADASESSVNYRFGFDRQAPDATQTGDFARPLLTDAAATRQAIVPGSIHGACDPSAAHYVHSGPATVLRRSDLVSLRSTSQPGRHSVAVRGIWWILWAGRDHQYELRRAEGIEYTARSNIVRPALPTEQLKSP